MGRTAGSERIDSQADGINLSLEAQRPCIQFWSMEESVGVISSLYEPIHK